MNKIMSEQCTNNDFEEGNTIVDQLNPSKKTPDVGLEPTTLSLEGWCSSDWANRAYIKE